MNKVPIILKRIPINNIINKLKKDLINSRHYTIIKVCICVCKKYICNERKTISINTYLTKL